MLYVMRHGPAEDRARTGRDADRALTSAGRAVVTRAAHALRSARDAGLPRIVSSPLLRARETAAIVGTLAGSAGIEIELHDALGADGDLPLGLVVELARRGHDAALVGHQPMVEHLVRRLSGRSDVVPAGFRTAMVVALELAMGSEGQVTGAEVRWVVDPHALGG